MTAGVSLSTHEGPLEVENISHRLRVHGNWSATMDISKAAPPPAVGSIGTLNITRSSGVVDSFTGSIRRAQVTPGTQNLSATLVGGSGHLLDLIPERHHTFGSSTVPAGVVLADIAQAAGERLAPGVEAELDALTFQRYTRVKGPAWAALDVLAFVLGPEVGWRILADGSLWMGVEAWPAIDAMAYYWRGDPRDGAVLYVPDGAPYRPGTMIDGARIVECCYRITPGRPVMEARAEVAGDPKIQAPLQPYARTYPATVVSQNADLTLNVVADVPLGNDLRNVPYKIGFAGTKIIIPSGSLVRVGFEGGLPTGIYAMNIDMDPAPTHRFALLADDVSAGNLAGVADPVTGVVTFTYTNTHGIQTSQLVTISGKIDGPGHHYAFGQKAPG